MTQTVDRLADIASEIAEGLRVEQEADFEQQGEDYVDETRPMRRDTRKNLFSKVKFVWRKDDQKILEDIRAAVDFLFEQMYADSYAIIDGFYEAMRIPKTVEGVVQKDSAGRVIWECDSKNQPIEDWGQLTGQDIEKTLLDITRLKLILAPELNNLLLEAVFAKHIADEKAEDAYAEIFEGTIGDRNAHAAQVARVDKYHAFYRYYLYTHAEVFMKELNNFSRVLERIRYWRIEGGT